MCVLWNGSFYRFSVLLEAGKAGTFLVIGYLGAEKEWQGASMTPEVLQLTPEIIQVGDRPPRHSLISCL